MTVVAVSMVKDEADVIETVVRHMAYHCDHVIVADNGSTDGTRDLLDALPCEVIDDPDPAYYQSRKMSALASYALSEHRADWVVPFDADEIWVPSVAATISEQLQRTDAMVAQAQVFDHICTDADVDGPPQKAMTYRLRNPGALPKVAARPVAGMVIEMGNHAVTYPGEMASPTVRNRLAVHHFPVRSPAQHLRKAKQGAAALALTDLDPSIGAHWRDWSKLIDRVGENLFADVFLDHWFYRADDERIVYDPAPVKP